MRYAAETTNNLEALLASAQREPVFIEQREREVAVLLSARTYEGLRAIAVQGLLNVCRPVSERAESLGLDEAKLIADA